MDSKKFKKTFDVIKSYRSMEKDQSDVLGSYTGLCERNETPTQDVDDL